MPKTSEPAKGLFQRLGVRGRLLLAFFGISAFAVLAAAAGMFSFLAVGDVLDRITQQRVPSALASLELSRQAERIVSERNFGPMHPDVAMGLNNLGLLYQTQGRYAKAEPVSKRALAVSDCARSASCSPSIA
jgi:hypothetical protein